QTLRALRFIIPCPLNRRRPCGRATCTATTAAPYTLQAGRGAGGGFAEILLPAIGRLLSAGIGKGVRCGQGGCELFGGYLRESDFQPGPCQGAPGTPYARVIA